MRALNRFLNKLEDIVISIDSFLLVMIAVIIFIQVVVRKVGISLPGTEELARYSYVVFAFLAWPIAALRGTDISITFLFDKLGKNARKYVLIFFHILMSVFAAICVYSMTKNISNAVGVVAPSNRWLHLNYIYIIVEIGLITTAVFHWIRIFFLATGQAVYMSQDEKDMMAIEAAKAEFDAKEAAEGGEGQ